MSIILLVIVIMVLFNINDTLADIREILESEDDKRDD